MKEMDISGSTSSYVLLVTDCPAEEYEEYQSLCATVDKLFSEAYKFSDTQLRMIRGFAGYGIVSQWQYAWDYDLARLLAAMCPVLRFKGWVDG